jgi:TatD DNase family protein
MIDFHAHIDLFPDPAAVVRRCVELGIYVVSVTNTPSAWEQTATLASQSSRIRTALGLHPQLARERKRELSLFIELIGRTRYIGEIGLDGAPECKEFWNDQIEVFSCILDTCSRTPGKILTIHSRRAAGEVLRLLQANPTAGIPVLHWFTGTDRELREAIDLGCWFSVGPAMAMSARARRQIQMMPADRILTESDGPFAQRDGAPVFPWDVGVMSSALSEIWQVSKQHVEQVLQRNLRRIVEPAVPTS